MAYKYKPNKYTIYDDALSFEENYKNEAVITKKKLDRLEEQVKISSADWAIGEAKFVDSVKDAGVSIEFNELEGTRRINFAIPGRPGKSAYETWLELGHTGSKEDFLQFCKGDSLKHRVEFTRTEVLEAPANTMINYFQDEVRVAVPSTATLEANKDDECKILVRFFAPEGTKYAKYAQASTVSDDIEMIEANNEDDGCVYVEDWLTIASADEEGNMVYKGTQSTEDDFFGYYIAAKWYNASEKLIGMDCIRINLVTEEQQYLERPYYTNRYYIKDEIDQKIEESKKQAIESVAAEVSYEPYIAENGNVYACGTAVYIDASTKEGYNICSWYDQNNKVKYLEFEVDKNVYGGDIRHKDEHRISYPSASVVLNSGSVSGIYGGGHGACDVAVSNVVINGGSVKWVAGAGGNNDEVNNRTGYAHVIVNNTDSAITLFGGSFNSYASCGEVLVEINGGTFDYITLGGSNGYTAIAKAIINGGDIKVLHGCCRGTMNNLEYEINGGNIEKLDIWGEGENTNPADDPKVYYAKVKISGGAITKLNPGVNLLIGKTITGTYVSNVIGNEEELATTLPGLIKENRPEEVLAMIEKALADAKEYTDAKFDTLDKRTKVKTI